MMERSEEFTRGDVEDGEEEDEETKTMKKKMALQSRQDEMVKKGERYNLLRLMMADRNREEEEDLRRRKQEAREMTILQAQQEQKLGQELLRRKNEETHVQRRRQALKNNSVELRRLKDHLRTSYEAEAAKVQLLEQRVRRENTKLREIEEDEKIRGWYQNDSFEKQQMLEARQRKEQYRRDLQGQLMLNHRLRQQKTEETRHERKLIEEANELLRLECLEEQRRKRETAARLHAEERDFFEAREISKFKEKQRLLKEDEKRARTLADKIEERGQSEDARAAAAAAREAMLERMTKKILEDESKRREQQDAVDELIAEEERSKLENRERNASLKKNITARGLLEDMRRQKLAIEEHKVREAEVDRAFADYLSRERDKSVAADKRKEEERRVKGIEYGKCLKEAIARKSIGYAAKILESQAMLNRDRKLDEAIRISIEEERSRMLVEHKQRLPGFLKPGMVTVRAPSICEQSS